MERGGGYLGPPEGVGIREGPNNLFLYRKKFIQKCLVA